MAHILLVDDVAAGRELLARALRDRGHRVTQAVDGQDAIDRYAREHADVAVLDVHLPRVSGIDAAARLRGVPGPHLRVILMSARADLESRLAALAMADDFIAKPVDPAELCARVEAQLRTRRVIEELRAKAGGAEGDRADGPGLLDRAALIDRLDDAWKRSARTSEPLTVMVSRVENGDLGPSIGSGSAPAVLAGAIQRCLRSLDVVGRWEDNVGALLLNTHLTGTLAAIERLRKELRRTAVGGATPVVSIGVAVHPGCAGDSAESLLSLAEAALVRARSEGAGSVCLQQAQLYVYRPAE